MRVKFEINGNHFEADFARPLHIGLPIDPSENPNCYFTEPLSIEPIKSGDFVGSIKLGGPVNHMRLSIAPHGNGTHTECSGHIFDNDLTIDKVITESHFPTQVVSIKPEQTENGACISEEQIKSLTIEPGIKALVIRTLPNSIIKKRHNYSGTNPPYISEGAMIKIVALGIDHLVIDLPSVDPEIDGGRLAAHKLFWRDKERQLKCTITELAYIPDTVIDNLYLLNLQVLRIAMDVSPSNPILFELSPGN